MRLNILLCCALLLGGCAGGIGSAPSGKPHTPAAVSPPAQEAAGIIECRYGEGCRPLPR
ncbi:MAG: hypothetical protein Q4A62_00580 [Eikenella sp.]|nr:hypothetical protein [Eikenella sp.]